MSNDNNGNSRLDRIEAIMLDLAAASVRHDNELSRVNQTLNRVAEQQAANQQAIANLINAQDLTRQDIASLTANIESLRHQVADWMSERNQ